MIAHIEWAEGHRRTVAGYVRTEDLATWGPVVLKLHSLICDISSSCSNRVRGVVCFSLTSINWFSYCENTDNDTVVEVVSISLSISVIDSTWLAALVITSSEKGSPAVCRVNIESESAIPPDEAEVWVIFSPLHEFSADP